MTKIRLYYNYNFCLCDKLIGVALCSVGMLNKHKIGLYSNILVKVLILFVR